MWGPGTVLGFMLGCVGVGGLVVVPLGLGAGLGISSIIVDGVWNGTGIYTGLEWGLGVLVGVPLGLGGQLG